METQKLFTRVEIKAVDTSQRLIEGWAAAIGNKDRTHDIIAKGAFDRTLNDPASDVVAFIGHDSSRLQVGEPSLMRADGDGLFTRTSVYDTPDGNALLEVARRRMMAGKTLGMSIGYRTTKDHWDSKAQARVIDDLDLVEYSFLASPALAANPLATVTGVKARKATGTGPVITTDDSYEDLICDLEEGACMALGVNYCSVCATFSDHVIVSAYSGMSDDMAYYDFPYTLNADGEPELGEPTSVDPAFVPSDAKARALAHVATHNATLLEGKTIMPLQHTRTASWDAAFVSALPDAAFAYVEGGGTAAKDDTDRTVPRSLRHYPHHNQDGSVDVAHLEHALEHAETMTGDLRAKSILHLAAHARTEIKHTIDAHASVWSEGAAAAMLVAGYQMDRILADIAEDRRSMERTGLDTKDGARLTAVTRERITALRDTLSQTLSWADQVESGDDGKMRVDMFKHKLAMLQLEEVS